MKLQFVDRDEFVAVMSIGDGAGESLSGKTMAREWFGKAIMDFVSPFVPSEEAIIDEAKKHVPQKSSKVYINLEQGKVILLGYTLSHE